MKISALDVYVDVNYDGVLTIEKLEYEYIHAVMLNNAWNRTRAIKVLGISRRTLQRKLNEMKKLGYEIGQSDWGKTK